MTNYALTVYQPDGPAPDPEVLGRIIADVDAVTEDMKQKGVWVFGGGLTPADSATVVRVQDGAPLITDGPYVEGKEHVGGYTIIDVEDLDAALYWGRRVAAATTLPIEVRAFEG